MKTKTIVCIFIIIIILVCIGLLAAKYIKAHYDNKRRSVKNKLKMKILTELFELIADAGAVSKTQPFMLYGTLLGKIRSDNILCHDFDVDYGIMSEQLDKFDNALAKLISTNPDYYTRKIYIWKYRAIHIYHRPTGLSADITSFSVMSNGDIRRDVPRFYSKYMLKESVATYPSDWILPLKPTLFLGKSTFIPAKSRKLLKCYYGKNYMIPDQICNSECEDCKPV